MDFRQTAERLLPERTVRRSLAVLALVFIAALPAGYFVSQPALRELAKTFADMAGMQRELAGGTLFLLILVNSVFTSLLLTFSGILAGVIPSLSVVFNGFALGLLFRYVSETEGSGTAAVRLLLPATLEVPALLISAALGVWLGIGFIRRMRGKESGTAVDQLSHAFQRYFVVVFPLLIAAAAVETILVLRGP